MLRNCLIAIVLLVVLGAAYGTLSARRFHGGERVVLPIIATAFTWVGLVVINGARYKYLDWRARRRSQSGAAPVDGELASATGTIAAPFATLVTPFSGQPCVAYSYEIGPFSDGARSAKEFAGAGFIPFTLKTAHGEIRIHSMPLLGELAAPEPPEDVDMQEAAARFVRERSFQQIGSLDLLTMTRELFKAHSGDGPIERDWRLGSGNADLSRMDVSEKYLAPGETITAWGRYSRAKNALTTDLDDVGFLRVERSAISRPVPAFPSEALGHLVGGILLVAIGNAFFAAGWFLAP